jgi:hypothetical protein
MIGFAVPTDAVTERATTDPHAPAICRLMSGAIPHLAKVICNPSCVPALLSN